jgi:thymidine kinase
MHGMSEALTLETIRAKLNDSPMNELMDEIQSYESFVIDKLNKVSEPYRHVLIKIDSLRKQHREETIRNCEHDFERFCEYHNDVYFICRKCGFEK